MDTNNEMNPGFVPEDTSKPEGFALRIPEDISVDEQPEVPCQAPAEEPQAEAPQQAPVMPPFVKAEPQPAAQPRQTYGYAQPAYTPYTPSFESFPVSKPPKEKKPRGSGGKAFKSVLCAVLALAVLISGCLITAGAVNARWESRAREMQEGFQTEIELMKELFDNKVGVLQEQLDGGSYSVQAPDGTVTVISADQAPGLVYSRNVQSVVQITCQITTSYYGQTSTGTSSGSGFVLTEDGYVVTNYHVVQGASSISFTTADEETYEAELVGYDDTNDVAVIKADVTGLQPAKLGSSDNLVVGDQVVAIGYPLSAQDATLTVGYISAKNRDVTTSGVAINMIQTDAAINSGNSGGPLFNMNGEVIGITTAKYSGTTSSGASIEGIGFAIPIDDVTGIISDLMAYGYVNSAYLGVMVRNMNDTEMAAAELYDFPVGVYVSSVEDDHCAKAAGVQAEDIIIELGGYEIESTTDLSRALRKFQGGDTTTITVYRPSEHGEVVMSITLDQKEPAQEEPIEDPEYSGQMPNNGSFEEWYDFFFGDGND